MDQTLSKNGISILLGLAVMFGLNWIGHHWFTNPSETIQAGSYSYEMPRSKSYTGGFDLSDREVDHEVLSDEEILAKAATTDAKAEAAKKTAEASKKAALAKQAAEAAKKSQLDKGTLSVATTDTSMQMHMSESSVSFQQDPPQALAAGSVATENQNSTTPQTPKQDETQRTAAEWLSLLSTHATTQLVAEFDADHVKGQVTDTDFYNIAFTLFDSQSQQNQQTGTEILSGDNSQSGLVYMSEKYSKESATSQATLWTFMVTFAQPTKFVGLNAALASTDTTVTPLALKVLGIAVTNAQSQVSVSGSPTGSTISGAGNGTRGVAGSVDPAALKQFETDLSQIAKGTSSDAQLAKSLLTQIQTMNP